MNWNLWYRQLAGVFVLAILMVTPAFGQRMGPNGCFDLDSLTCVSTDVVEGTIAGLGMAGRVPIRVINFEITEVHKGALHPGQIIPVAFADSYTKGSHHLPNTLEYGSQLILFLTKGPSLLTLDNGGWGRTIPGTLLPRLPYDAEYYWIAPSGMRYIDEDGVKGFYSSSGVLYELEDQRRGNTGRTFPTLKEFHGLLGEAIRKTKGLAEALYFCPVSPDPSWMLELLRQRAGEMDPRVNDIIVPLIARRMIKENDLKLLDAALLIPLPGDNFLFSRGFNSAEGREYLCERLNHPQTSAEHRLRYVHGLLGAGPLFTRWPTADDDPEFAEFRQNTYQDYRTLLARQAWKQSKDEAASLELVAGLRHTEQYYVGNKNPETNASLKFELTVLRELYFSTSSDAVKYEVERITAKADRSSYNQLESRCHEIVSMLKPGDSKYPGDPVENGSFKYTCEWTTLEPVDVEKAWIVLDNLDTHQSYVLPLEDASVFKKQGDRIFSAAAPLQEDFAHGKYRGHLEFEKEGELISVGHGFEAKL